MKHSITIEIDEETKTLKITHNGQTFELQSLAIFGGDAQNQEIFIKLFGSSADAAWAYAQGFRIANSVEGGKALKNFYKQSAAHICQIIDPNAYENEITANEALNRWECDDQTRWFDMDSEDVLDDKQISENNKKRWN